MKMSGGNNSCSNILVESNSPHRSIHSDIWGKYSISNKRYKDNRDGITTYLNNVNGMPFFGGKGIKAINWQINEDYGPNKTPKLINFGCNKANYPGKCNIRKWNIINVINGNKMSKAININITCIENDKDETVTSVPSTTPESTMNSTSKPGNDGYETTIGLIGIAFVLSFIIIIGVILLCKNFRKSNQPYGTYMKSLVENISESNGYGSRNPSTEVTYLKPEQRINPFFDLKKQANLLSYDTKREIPRSLFTITSQIGKGNFGNVSKGELKELYGSNTLTPIAIKSMNGPAEGSDFQDFLEEIKIMSYVQPHLNLVSMIGSCSSNIDNQKEMWLILEFCPHGDLKSFLTQNKNEILHGLKHKNIVLNDRCLIQWVHDIAQGMKYLSVKKIMHGDLAARNVLLSDSDLVGNNLIAKIADFGLSKKFYDNITYEKQSRLHIPWKWMAPEYLIRDVFMINSDVWSFGVLIYEVFSFGRSPYGHQSYDEVEKRLEEGYRLPCPMEIQSITSWSPEMFYNEITHVCFKEDPNNRASFTTVVNLIESSLYEEEMENYRITTERYKANCYENYIKLGRR